MTSARQAPAEAVAVKEAVETLAVADQEAVVAPCRDGNQTPLF